MPKRFTILTAALLVSAAMLSVAGLGSNVTPFKNVVIGGGSEDADGGIDLTETGEIIGASIFSSVVAGLNPEIKLVDGDVAHGMTDLFTTDTVLEITTWTDLVGGINFTAVSENNSLALALRGYTAAAPAANMAGVVLMAGKKSGTGTQDMGASEVAFRFANSDNSSEYLEIFGDGTVAINGVLGIGVSGSANPLHIYVNDSVTGDNAGLQIEQDGTGDAQAQFRSTGIRRWAIGSRIFDGKFYIGSSSTLGTDPNLIFTVDGNVQSAADFAVLGSFFPKQVTDAGPMTATNGTIGEVVFNTSDSKFYGCTATGTPATWAAFH